MVMQRRKSFDNEQDPRISLEEDLEDDRCSDAEYGFSMGYYGEEEY